MKRNYLQEIVIFLLFLLLFLRFAIAYGGILSNKIENWQLAAGTKTG